MTIAPAKCSGAGGAITGINVTNAGNYQWFDTVNHLVGQGLDVYNLPAGKYRLKVTNATGCETSTTNLTIRVASFIPISVVDVDTDSEKCNGRNAFAQPRSFTNDSTLYTYRWIDPHSGQTLGTNTGLYNLPTGSYHLLATDTNHCESQIYSVGLGAYPAPIIDASKVVVTHDACNQALGSIRGLQVSGTIGAVTYTWRDETAAIVANTLSLTNAKAGHYSLTVDNPQLCTVVSNALSITNSNTNLLPPPYDDLVIPRHHDATLQLKGPATGSYRLYADAAATRLLEENNTGLFVRKKVASDTVYYVQHAVGDCTPSTSRIGIRVVDESFFSIPNAFTPNNDGNNDRLHIRITGLLQLKYFRVYSRWGQLVFESRQLNEGWDGNWQQKPQPTGTYVWIAEGTDILGKPIRQKGQVLLLR
ncbi:gliding motility-associated C-terminal domain-containing protein [Paraflavitalea pollutisoli]|uniref:gliding motility-associated C-terminal domain-containing protein n=1 Tax=Paraflavitalea pollutisoli TaxID=3034143 RepID=UPI0023ECB90E|nr:gliding motility-associated C-terminal domain-containing protein [Paraflavitalea sp. H1-2-19X]